MEWDSESDGNEDEDVQYMGGKAEDEDESMQTELLSGSRKKPTKNNGKKKKKKKKKVNNVDLDDEIANTPDSAISNMGNPKSYYQMPDYSDDDMEKDLEEMEDDELKVKDKGKKMTILIHDRFKRIKDRNRKRYWEKKKADEKAQMMKVLSKSGSKEEIAKLNNGFVKQEQSN